MKRFAWIWGITALCACIVLTAMSVMTRHVMRLEEVSQKATQEKEHAEKIRLALWRMESEASAILLLENTRSAEKFLESTPEALPNHVRTYFQFNAAGGYSCLPVAAQSEQNTLGLILNGSCTSVHGVLQNSYVANSMANKWSVSAPVDVNSYQEWGAQSVSQNLEKAIRNEQLKRNIGNIKYQNIQQIDLPNTQQSLIAGEFRPIWMDGELFLVRKLLGNNSNTAQGVWLHKDVLKEKLLSLAKDLFADANLIPVAQNISAIEGAIDSSLPPVPEKMVDDALALVTLPWRLSVIESRASYVPSTSAAITAMRFAWIGMGIAFAAGTALVMGLVRMSERRATFVSSVTHELRTPLTTFQLYSDLLASGMVREEEKKNLYYETLRREADRLGHLVENVLAFAKVERGSARGGKKLCQWNDFLPAILERMQQRLHQANLQLETDFADQIMEQKIHTDPVALEHILFNLADNSAKYAHPHSSAKVILTITQNSKNWTITLRDFGPGIEKSERHHIFRAFQKSKNANDSCKSGVGLGLSLSRRLAKSINATLTYDASNPQGATFILKSPI